MITTAVLIFLYSYFFGKKSDDDKEYQRYQILFAEEAFEIRDYSKALYASISLLGRYKDKANAGFRALGAYIFGANSTREKICMTTPIRIQSNGVATKMSFRLPHNYSMETIPSPKNRDVKIGELAHGLCAVISFGGFSSNWIINKKIEELKKLLVSHDIESTGDFEFLSYNAPYKLIGRRNEILVHLKLDPVNIKKIDYLAHLPKAKALSY